VTRKKISVDKRDAARILLTEVLPYEVPVIFSNERLYKFVRTDQLKKGNVPALIQAIFRTGRKDWTIPFEYSIRQGVSKRRTLGVVHPRTQIAFCSLYEDYHLYILSLCSKSEYSLRAPASVASFYFDKKVAPKDNAMIDSSVEIEPDLFHRQARYASSYFAYRNYSQLYKFIDSPEFHDLETRHPVLLQFDVKRCFPSIYTHSIAWAVKGKQHAKNNIGAYSFERRFDELMQGSNYKETAGIVIGPEFSRVFAEIIFQEIDKRVSAAVTAQNLNVSIRRYIDDFFVFASDRKSAEIVYEITQEHLRSFKLYVNEAKTDFFNRPFATPQTVAKRDVNEVLSSSLLAWISDLRPVNENVKRDVLAHRKAPSRHPAKEASSLIRDLKVAVRRSGVTFDMVSGFALGVLTKSLFRLGQRAKALKTIDKIEQKLSVTLRIAVEVAFFLYSMDARVRTTYRIAQIMLIASRICKDCGISSSVVDDVASRLAAKAMAELSQQSVCGIETMNLLIALKSLDNATNVAEAVLLGAHSSANSHSDVRVRRNYFEIMSLLYYAGTNPAYSNLVSAVMVDIEKIISETETTDRDAEAMLLIFDVISCPSLNDAFKKKIVGIAMRRILGGVPTDAEIDDAIKYAATHVSFIDWDARPNLERLLQKKELTLAY